MKDNKCTVRYLGYQTLPDGGRGFDFSFALAGAALTLITVEAPIGLFSGPDHIAIQEGAGICYETLKSRIETDFGRLPSRFSLTLMTSLNTERSPNPMATEVEVAPLTGTLGAIATE